MTSHSETSTPPNGTTLAKEGNASADGVHASNNIVEKQALAEDKPSARDVHGIKWALVCVALYITCFLYGLDTTIAADIQAPIISEFGNVDQLTWVGSGFPLGSLSAALLIGSLYGSIDMKWIYLVSLVIFEAASALCGAAPNMNALIVGRVIAGLGGSGVYMGSLNYFSVCTSEEERGTYLAGVGFIWGLGSILGPVIGGAFSISSATWRWSFYINLVVAAIFIPVYLFFMPSVVLDKSATTRQKLAKTDYFGWFLWAGFINAFTIVLTFAGALWPWNDGRTIATWVVFGVVLGLFILQQRFKLFVRGTPIFPGHLVKQYTHVVLYFGTAATTTNLFVPTYYIPLYFQFTRDDTAIMAAVRLLPFILVLIAVNMFSGYLLPKLGYYWVLYLISGIFIIPGAAAMLTVTPDTPPGNIYGYTVLIAIGAGLSIQTGYTVATVLRNQAGHPEDVPNAVMFQNTSQLGSTLVALVISGQLFQSYSYNFLKDVLGGQGFSDAELRDAILGTQSTVFQQVSDELRPAAINAITMGMSKVYILSLVGGVIALGVGLALPKRKLSGIQITAGG